MQENQEEFIEFKASHSVRPNLWSTSINRLIALEVLHRNFPDEPLIHIESDVWVSKHFPFELFVRNNLKIAFPIVNVSAAIASTIYSARHSYTKYLADYIVESFNQGFNRTDMQLLADFAREKSIVTILPSFPKGIPLGQEGSLVFASQESHSLFPGIFDGATLGIFLTGVDPIHNFGFRKMFSKPSDHLFDGQLLDFLLKEDDQLEIDLGHSSYPIYSLHIHSKDLRFFQNSERKRRFQKILKRLKEKPGEIVYEFDPRSFKGNWIHYIKALSFKLYKHFRRR